MADAYQLTQEERDTLNGAMEIIERLTVKGASWQAHFARYNGSPFSFSITYFDSAKVQHSWVKGKTLADKLQTALDLEAGTAANAANTADAEKARQARIENLKSQLATLTGEAA